MSAPDTIRPPEPGGSLVVAWRLAGRRGLVVGGGAVAGARVVAALDADAEVVVVAPALGASLRARRARGELVWRPRAWALDDLDGPGRPAVVLGCLDDGAESARLAQACRERGIPVNCADQPAACDFWFAAQVRRGPLQLAIATNGAGPALGARLKDRLAAALPDGVGPAIGAFGALRRALRAAAPAPAASPRRMAWLRTVARSWPWEALAALDAPAVAALAARFADGAPPPPAPVAGSGRAPGPGGVVLVGAGPGDPALLTAAAREALAAAELILADRLVPPALWAGLAAEVRVARKWPGRADAAQAELEAAAVAAARAGRRVVRLKCGDPFLFGRGGEECARLTAQGVAVRVVPGVSSALAAPLLAGIPVTWRGTADRVVVLTGRGQGGRRPRLPDPAPDTTWVWLMAVGALPWLAPALCGRGFPAGMPVALIERAGQPTARTTWSSLGRVVADAAAAGVRAPAVLVVGPVVGRAAALAEAGHGGSDAAPRGGGTGAVASVAIARRGAAAGPGAWGAG